MSDFDLVIRGGTIGTASAVFDADIGVKDGAIAAIGKNLPKGRAELDAKGKLVLPGGVDTHTHIEEPRGGPTANADSFITAGASAAAGGTTTVIGFARQERGGSLTQAVAEHHERAKKSLIDYSFHMILTEPRPDILQQEVPALIASGHRSLKIFLTYEGARISDAEALQVLATARRHGALVCIHAEHHDLIDFHKNALLAAGLTLPKHHAWSKPMVVERECVHRVCAMAEALDVPIQVFHVSGAESAEEVERAQKRGLKIWAETCPQYLVLTTEDMDRPGFEGAKYVFSPAARSAPDHAALWDAMRRGIISNVSSDHASTRYGVVKGRISLQQFVALTATNPAEIFGMAPRKGSIVVGADADFALWDPTRRVTITNDILLHGSDHTPYDGMEVTGWPEATFVRGVPVVQGGKAVVAAGHGQFIPRGAYEMIKPRGVFPGPFNPVDGVAV